MPMPSLRMSSLVGATPLGDARNPFSRHQFTTGQGADDDYRLLEKRHSTRGWQRVILNPFCNVAIHRSGKLVTHSLAGELVQSFASPHYAARACRVCRHN
jgi:hypothetical protein